MVRVTTPAQTSRPPQVAPGTFNGDSLDVLTAQIEAKFADRVIANVGLCISLHSYESIGDPYVYPSDGAAHYKVSIHKHTTCMLLRRTLRLNFAGKLVTATTVRDALSRLSSRKCLITCAESICRLLWNVTQLSRRRRFREETSERAQNEYVDMQVGVERRATWGAVESREDEQRSNCVSL